MRSFVAVAAFELAFDVPPRLNLALGRPARLSSTAHSGYSAASFATDGQTQMDDVIASGCAQTDVEAAPWLEVDLEHRAVVVAVRLYPRLRIPAAGPVSKRGMAAVLPATRRIQRWGYF